jgi:hypothetical protein
MMVRHPPVARGEAALCHGLDPVSCAARFTGPLLRTFGFGTDSEIA